LARRRRALCLVNGDLSPDEHCYTLAVLPNARVQYFIAERGAEMACSRRYRRGGVLVEAAAWSRCSLDIRLTFAYYSPWYSAHPGALCSIFARERRAQMRMRVSKRTSGDAGAVVFGGAQAIALRHVNPNGSHSVANVSANNGEPTLVITP